MNLFLQLLANGIVNGAMYALLAVSFGLVYRGTRVFHVAFGGLFVLAAMLFHTLVTVAGLNWWLAGVGAVVLAGLAGWIVEDGFYRLFFVRHSSAGAVMVASLGLAVVIENVLALIYGNEIRTIPRGLASSIVLGSVRLTVIQVAQFVVSVALLVVLWVLATRHSTFKVFRAMGENQDLLRTHGLPLMSYRARLFALSGAVAAVPACLMMVDVGMDVHAGLSIMLIAVVAVLAGGVDRMGAWVAGGFLLAILQSLVVWKFSAKWMDLVAFVLLLIVLLFRPEGLLGIRKRWEES